MVVERCVVRCVVTDTGARGGNERTTGTPPAAGTPQQPWVGKLLQLAGSGGEKDVDHARVSCVPIIYRLWVGKGVGQGSSVGSRNGRHARRRSKCTGGSCHLAALRRGGGARAGNAGAGAAGGVAGAVRRAARGLGRGGAGHLAAVAVDLVRHGAGVGVPGCEGPQGWRWHFQSGAKADAPRTRRGACGSRTPSPSRAREPVW